MMYLVLGYGFWNVLFSSYDNKGVESTLKQLHVDTTVIRTDDKRVSIISCNL